MAASGGSGHSRGRYLIGFVLAVVLTAIPFALVAGGWLAPASTFLVIAAAAVMQVVVHLRFFLNLGFASTPRENLLAFAFAAVLIGLMVGGTLWIMFDLDYRHAM